MDGEKPKFTARRVGEVKPGAGKRPIKVTLRSPAIVKKILAKSPKMRDSAKFSDVYVSPDRTPDQRAKQRLLVEELKRRKKDEPLKRHFIRGGRVETTDVQ